MNLYIRYFDQDTVATNMDEAVAFLETIKDLKLTGEVINRVSGFYSSNNLYPYRLKVGYSNYVLFLKTEAATLEEFKEIERIRNEQKAAGTYQPEKKKSVLELMAEANPGWYDAVLTFKRVVPIKDTNKFQYLDTRFRAKLKAQSPLDCYERIVEHLRNRQDVDPRSQYPSAKSIISNTPSWANQSISKIEFVTYNKRVGTQSRLFSDLRLASQVNSNNL